MKDFNFKRICLSWLRHIIVTNRANYRTARPTANKLAGRWFKTSLAGSKIKYPTQGGVFNFGSGGQLAHANLRAEINLGH